MLFHPSGDYIATRLRQALLALALSGACATVLAESLACPDLATAVQVGVCPAEEELAYTFKGYCSDNARMYDREEQLCSDYARYREKKNVSLWETRDGRFSSYVNCEPGKAGLNAARAIRVGVSKQGSVTRVACTYDSGVVFTHRTKATCSVDAAACTSDPAACRAQCD